MRVNYRRIRIRCVHSFTKVPGAGEARNIEFLHDWPSLPSVSDSFRLDRSLRLTKCLYQTGIIAHLRSFGFRFSGSAQVASRPFGCRLSRRAAGKGADHGCFLSVSDICALKSTYLWLINLDSVLWITRCRQACLCRMGHGSAHGCRSWWFGCRCGRAGPESCGCHGHVRVSGWQKNDGSCERWRPC